MMSSHNASHLCLLAFVTASLLGSSTTAAGASMAEISEAVSGLCSGKGSKNHFSVKGSGSVNASKAVSLVVDGKIAGEVSFSKDEWAGVEAVTSGDYTACVGKLTPTFIEKFAPPDNTLKQPDVKTLDVRLGIKGLRDYCEKNPGVPPPVSLMNPPQQVQCRNGTTDTARPVCLCP